MAQPSDLQTSMNTVQWTNGQRLITGSFVMGLFTLIFSIFSGMGTWTGGVYSLNSASVNYTSTGGISQTVGAALGRTLYLTDFAGADPTGSSNSANGVIAALTALNTRGAARWLSPRGLTRSAAPPIAAPLARRRPTGRSSSRPARGSSPTAP